MINFRENSAKSSGIGIVIELSAISCHSLEADFWPEFLGHVHIALMLKKFDMSKDEIFMPHFLATLSPNLLDKSVDRRVREFSVFLSHSVVITLTNLWHEFAVISGRQVHKSRGKPLVSHKIGAKSPP